MMQQSPQPMMQQTPMMSPQMGMAPPPSNKIGMDKAPYVPCTFEIGPPCLL